jgi:uncharacterized OsmC-like protein
MARISAKLSAGLVVDISDGRHEWQADEPPAAGGTDVGPNPYELLLSSLAACTCITVAAYCRHKGLTLNSITATYEFAHVHADDCKDCDIPDKGFIETITSNVQIEGDFDEAQQKRLAQVARRCPVHKTLAAGVAFEDNASFTAPVQ